MIAADGYVITPFHVIMLTNFFIWKDHKALMVTPTKIICIDGKNSICGGRIEFTIFIVYHGPVN